MKALRIVLTQNKAHYRKEESVLNKMTYPLPPFSTVIGALHNACGFREYHSMNLSIQGQYKSLIKQPYTDYCFLNSAMDDRGTLVKLYNGRLQSASFEKVAKAVKSQGSSFRKGITIQVYDKELLKEFRTLKQLNDDIATFKKTRLKKIQETIKSLKLNLATKKSALDKNSLEFLEISNREKVLKNREKLLNDRVKAFEKNNYKDKISRFQSLTTALKFYEVLHDVKLILHVSSDDDTLKRIKENIYNLKAIGRSEDFVDVKECKEVELSEDLKEDVKSEYSAFLNYRDVKDEKLLLNERGSGIVASGTKYYINKNYNICSGQRIFEKKKVVYASNYVIEELSDNIYLDEGYIVNLN